MNVGNHTGESRKHKAKQRQRYTEFLLCESIYMKFRNRRNGTTVLKGSVPATVRGMTGAGGSPKGASDICLWIWGLWL